MNPPEFRRAGQLFTIFEHTLDVKRESFLSHILGFIDIFLSSDTSGKVWERYAEPQL